VTEGRAALFGLEAFDPLGDTRMVGEQVPERTGAPLEQVGLGHLLERADGWVHPDLPRRILVGLALQDQPESALDEDETEQQQDRDGEQHDARTDTLE
jgi:hypothetical protein